MKVSFQQFSYPDNSEYVIVFNQFRMDDVMILHVIEHLKENYSSITLNPNKIYPRSLSSIFYFDDKDDEAAFILLMSPWEKASTYNHGEFIKSRVVDI